MEEITIQAERRLEHFEDCQSAIDQLFQTALDAKGASAFDEFLDFVQHFNKISVYNAMLVKIQRPGASAVGNRDQWAEKRRVIRPDAVPIMILQPFGPVRFIYELSDTVGAPIEGENQGNIFADGRLPPGVYYHTCSGADSYGIEVIETNQYGSHLAGTASGIGIIPEAISQHVKYRFRVRVNAQHDEPTKFATLAHELGHIYCGHVGSDPKGRWPDHRSLSRQHAECEAEAVAWLVCQRNGIQSRSKDYLHHLVKTVDLPKVSMYAIFEAANRVESRTPPNRKRA
jgi:hypothetical protein